MIWGSDDHQSEASSSDWATNQLSHRERYHGQGPEEALGVEYEAIDDAIVFQTTAE
jgi:hypothetical protein